MPNTCKVEMKHLERVRGTQGMFAVKYLFGEADVARNFYYLRTTNGKGIFRRKKQPKIFGSKTVIRRGFRKILTFVICQIAFKIFQKITLKPL